MATYLKHKPTGDIYIATALLMDRNDMVELTAKEIGYITGAAKRKEKAAATKAEPVKETATAPDPVVTDKAKKTTK
jgi:hypothetical protein